MTIAVLIGLFILLLFIGTPVALAMGVTSLVVAMMLDIPLSMIAQRMVAGINSFPLLAIPFFILAGEIMNEGGISRRLVALSDALVGRFRGGLAIVNVKTSMLFGGISGSALADTSSVGSIMIPMMKKKGYDTDYSVAVTVSSASQGIIIPPSHNMIIYSLAAGGVSISSLFMAGIVPGIILGIALMVTAYIIAVKRKYPREEKVTFNQALKVFRESIPGLFTGIIIIGGVISGVFTVTESAAVGAAYAFFISFIVNRDVSLSKMLPVLLRTTKTLALVIFLIAASSAYAWLLAFLRVPALIAESLLGMTTNPYLVILIIVLILLALGTILDVAPVILISTPILLPIAISIGMDPIQYGIVMMLCLGVGLVTPPVGAALFVGSAIGKVPVEKAVKALLPFYLCMLVVLLLIAFIPNIVMFIPELLQL
jgi:tripartite ATP-independent transporter DctM subunit